MPRTVRLLTTIRAIKEWASGQDKLADVAWELQLPPQSLIKILLENFICGPDGQVIDGVSPDEAVSAILLALILHERSKRLELKKRWLAKNR